MTPPSGYLKEDTAGAAWGFAANMLFGMLDEALGGHAGDAIENFMGETGMKLLRGARDTLYTLGALADGVLLVNTLSAGRLALFAGRFNVGKANVGRALFGHPGSGILTIKKNYASSELPASKSTPNARIALKGSSSKTGERFLKKIVIYDLNGDLVSIVERHKNHHGGRWHGEIMKVGQYPLRTGDKYFINYTKAYQLFMMQQWWKWRFIEVIGCIYERIK